jgi:hypothetical protein
MKRGEYISATFVLTFAKWMHVCHDLSMDNVRLHEPSIINLESHYSFSDIEASVKLFKVEPGELYPVGKGGLDTESAFDI